MKNVAPSVPYAMLSLVEIPIEAARKTVLPLRNRRLATDDSQLAACVTENRQSTTMEQSTLSVSAQHSTSYRALVVYSVGSPTL
jgi:hypothetical protein